MLFMEVLLNLGICMNKAGQVTLETLQHVNECHAESGDSYLMNNKEFFNFLNFDHHKVKASDIENNANVSKLAKLN